MNGIYKLLWVCFTCKLGDSRKWTNLSADFKVSDSFNKTAKTISVLHEKSQITLMVSKEIFRSLCRAVGSTFYWEILFAPVTLGTKIERPRKGNKCMKNITRKKVLVHHVWDESLLLRNFDRVCLFAWMWVQWGCLEIFLFSFFEALWKT